uniref:Uncharacterized protein n=1 Tax=Solanum lycopersicum TaxID=4081 RepID=A0A3Q7IAK0_SOLLC
MKQKDQVTTMFHLHEATALSINRELEFLQCFDNTRPCTQTRYKQRKFRITNFLNIRGKLKTKKDQNHRLKGPKMVEIHHYLAIPSSSGRVSSLISGISSSSSARACNTA